MEALELEPIATQVDEKTATALEKSKGFSVTDTGGYNAAAEFLLTLKDLQKEIDATFDEPIRKAYETHRSICAAKKKHSEPIDQAERIIKPKIGAFLAEQKRLREAEERRREEIAKKQLEQEQKELAKQLRKEGDKEGAKEVLETAVFVPPVHVAKSEFIPPVAGISDKENWKHQVTDLMALVRAVAENKAPITALCANDKFLGSQARAFKKKGQLYAGVVIYSETGISAGRR